MLAIVCLLQPLITLAARVDPYYAMVVIPSQSAEDVRVGFDVAIREALLNLSGDQTSVDRLMAGGMLSGFDSLVASRRLLSSDSAADYGFAISGSERVLEVNFFEQPLNDLLQKLELPQWQLERPETLVWVVRQTPFNAEYPDLESPGMSRRLMSNLSRRYAMPLVVPEYDLEDLRAINAQRLLDEGLAALPEQVLERYPVDRMLLLVLQAGSRSTSVSASLIGLVNPDRWQSSGVNETAAIADAIGELRRLMGRELSVAASASGHNTVRLEVRDIRSDIEYQAVVRYLSELIVIEQMDILQASPSGLLLNLITSTTSTGLSRVLASSDLLESASAEAWQPVQGLTFQIRR